MFQKIIKILLGNVDCHILAHQIILTIEAEEKIFSLLVITLYSGVKAKSLFRNNKKYLKEGEVLTLIRARI